MTPTPPDATPAIEVDGLTHRYPKSHVLAVDGATFSVPSGTIHGFIGPNGAGKTTSLKVLATLVRPQGGRVRVFGYDVVRSIRAVRARIGFMPDHFSLYPKMTVREYLDFFGAAYGLSWKERRRVVGDAIELTDLSNRVDQVLDGLSRGLQQRVSLARVLVHDPKLLLLDEPASGLDPRARIELMEILRALARLGKTVFISSHILSELQDLCDSVTIIDRGRVKFSGSMEELAGGASTLVRYAVSLAAPSAALDDLIGAGMPGVERVLAGDADARVVTVDLDPAATSLNSLLTAAIACGAEIAQVERQGRQLNQAFMELTEPGVGE